MKTYSGVPQSNAKKLDYAWQDQFKDGSEAYSLPDEYGMPANDTFADALMAFEDAEAAKLNYDLDLLRWMYPHVENLEAHPAFWGIQRHKRAEAERRNAELAKLSPAVLAKSRADWTRADWNVLIAAGLARIEYGDTGDRVTVHFVLLKDAVRGYLDGIDDATEENLARLGL